MLQNVPYTRFKPQRYGVSVAKLSQQLQFKILKKNRIRQWGSFSTAAFNLLNLFVLLTQQETGNEACIGFVLTTSELNIQQDVG